MTEPRRCLIFDPFSGISGDMILGALVELGLGEEWLAELVASLRIGARLSTNAVTRGSIAAHAVRVTPARKEPERRLADVLEIIDRAGLAPDVRDKASSVFQRLAEVEGQIHGLAREDVHFHELGATDAIVDVVGSCAGIAALAVEECFTRPVAVGRGWVSAAHGKLPLPAPATLKLLEGIALVDSAVEAEMTTPTGAVLLAEWTAGRSPPSGFVPIRSAFGAGSRDPSTHPNCLRLILAHLDVRGSLRLVQADVDDMSPEYVPPLRESLLAAGAIDVWMHPVQMKKGRTGIRIEALVPDLAAAAVQRALFEGSTTLGLRYWPVGREVLPRATKTIEWRGFTIRVKASTSPDGHIRGKPEYDDVLEAAKALGLPPAQAKREIEKLLAGHLFVG